MYPCAIGLALLVFHLELDLKRVPGIEPHLLGVAWDEVDVVFRAVELGVGEEKEPLHFSDGEDRLILPGDDLDVPALPRRPGPASRICRPIPAAAHPW